MTVTIQLTTAGIDTGTFSIFSNLDLVTPIVTGISRASLLTGYAVVVPNGATSVIVKSNTVNCTNQVTIPISGITTTTTTTTQMCSTVTYGYDTFDPQTACDQYFSSPTSLQWGGGILYYENPGDPCGLTATIADPGYYSDGSSIWYWDGSNSFTFDSSCSTLKTITIHAKRTGSITGIQGIQIVTSQDSGATWQVVVSSANLTTGFNSTNQWNQSVTVGEPLWIGAILSASSSPISFGAALTSTGCLNAIRYCGNPSTVTVVSGSSCNAPFAGPGAYNFGTVLADGDVYLNFPTLMSETGSYLYSECVPT